MKRLTALILTVILLLSAPPAVIAADEGPALDGARLGTPVLLSAESAAGGVRVTWQAVSGAAQYRVFRRRADGGWKTLGDTAGTAYTDKRAPYDTESVYTVRCLSADGKRFTSGYDAGGVAAVRLRAPALLSAFASSGRATVTWSVVPGAARYRVFRRRADGGWRTLGDTTGTVFTDGRAGGAGVYTVRCLSADGKRFTSGYDAGGIAAAPAQTARDLLANTDAAQRTDQLVLVVDHSLTLWSRAESGAWESTLDTYCGYGLNGMRGADIRREGDNTTPIGAFPLTMAFGTAEDPGALLPYRRVTQRSYWSAADDATYNTWVESDTYVRGEHLADYPQYKYAMVIGFNEDPVVYGRGSAIFIHIKSADHWYTGGCVSLTESDMLSLLYAVAPGAYIVIVPSLAALADY